MTDKTLTATIEINRNGLDIEVEVSGYYEPGHTETRDEPGFNASVDLDNDNIGYAWDSAKKKWCIPHALTNDEVKDANQALENALISYQEDMAEREGMSREDW